jgi:hypothetical protein
MQLQSEKRFCMKNIIMRNPEKACFLPVKRFFSCIKKNKKATSSIETAKLYFSKKKHLYFIFFNYFCNHFF